MFKVLNITDQSFQSCSATAARLDHVAASWHGTLYLSLTLDICLILGFMLTQENCRNLYYTISVSLFLCRVQIYFLSLLK